MDFFQAIVLGIVQALTEFLPVSSSGHLVILQHLFGLEEAELFFDISVHLGTLVAVLILFRRDILSMISAVWQFILQKSKGMPSSESGGLNPHVKMAWYLFLGSIPTGILGILFRRVADQLFSSVLITGVMLMVTGLLLWTTRLVRDKQKPLDIDRFSVPLALVIGLVQGLAIMPGISRSGATISAGLLLGLDRELAARFSFLLSIPAILGAGFLGITDLPKQADPVIQLALLGALSSCVVGYFALRVLLRLVKQGRLHVFAPYCLLLGISAVIFGT